MKQATKQANIIIQSLILGCVLVISFPLIVTAERGLSIGQTTITTQQGENILLYQESHALVIGISNYTEWPALPGVQQDVADVETALEAQGFAVEVKMDLDKVGLDQAFSDFISQYGQDPNNRLLFYFAGHGHTVTTTYGEELGYIVPVDAPNPNFDPAEFQRKAIEMQQIEIYAKRIQSKHALFLFDACFSGSLFALSRAVPEIINYKTAQPVRQFITSGSAEETVPDESIFRSQFVRALQGEADTDQDGYVTGTELGEFLQKTVVNYSRNAQHPQYGKIRNPNLDKGDFVFRLSIQIEAEVTVTLETPSESTFSLDDLEEAAKQEQDVKVAWEAKLKEMEAAFAKVTEYEKQDISTELKIKAWERFAQAFSEDNPYSTRDEELRSAAQEKKTYWQKSVVPSPTPTPQLPAQLQIEQIIQKTEQLGEQSIEQAAQQTQEALQQVEETLAKLQTTPVPTIPAVSDSKTWTDPVTGIEFVWIEGGCFQMGSPKGESGRTFNEDPQHDVCVEGFWIGRYEVTQEQWQKIMADNPAHFRRSPNHPVERVSWNDIQGLLDKLNENPPSGMEGEGYIYRLPSEAEWEYAARAGTTTAYSFGDDPDELEQYGWYSKNSGKETHAVGQLKPNAFGLYDMHGNVWEWCTDAWHRNYNDAPTDGSGWGAEERSLARVIRGGAWNTEDRKCRSARREKSLVGIRPYAIGFRLVIAPAKPSESVSEQ